MKIEKQQIGYVEGTTEKQILKLMRHELGHCIDNAIRLRKNSQRQKVFGSSQKEYPDYYTPKKYAQGYVHYLGDNYAQSHPDEDFAETFAVWLDPKSDWRNRYATKRANVKLEFMDQLMRSLRNKRPQLKNKFRVDPIEKLKITLKEHYQLKRSRLKLNRLDRIDRELKTLQVKDEGLGQRELLSSYLRKERKNLCRNLSRSSGTYVYQVNYVINKTIERAERMNIITTKEQLHRQAPLLLERNYRYLKEKQKLRFYL
ncbi:MAG: putative zinc-binding metallopeptidase [Bdellovibrionales bacterium]|nr:putative zinc-binding metallopeptidase [Bdellovibrionales bacterium]